MLIDARGKACPEPVVLAIKALNSKPADEDLEVLVDNIAAVENLKRMAGQKGFNVSADQKGPKDYSVMITGSTEAAASSPEPQSEDNILVAVNTNIMGRGSDDLGQALMKGFIYAITQQEKLPKTVLLYNGGAKLSVEGSESLEDLKWLADNGVEIVTCGTCLNFYGLTEKLAVGIVTNMYSIVEYLMKADKVIKP